MNRILSTLLCVALGASASLGAFQLGSQLAHADTPALLDAGAPRVLLVDAALPPTTPASGSATSSPTTSSSVDSTTLLEEYKELRAAYEELKGAKDGSARTLLYAATLAAGLKFLLDLLKLLSDRLDRGKKYIPWVATSLAVPIALLGHYAAGATWFDSLIYAGAGPGAVVVHELFALFAKQPAQAPSQAGVSRLNVMLSLVAIGATAMLVISSCGPKTTAAIHQALICAESAAVKDLTPTVESILTSGVDNWEEQMTALAEAFGVDAINCAVSAVKSQMATKLGAGQDTSAIQRADEWLSKHGGAAP